MQDILTALPTDTTMPDEHAGLMLRPQSGPRSWASNDADYRAIEAMLRPVDPQRRWGGLSRTTTPEGLTLYLCREHAATYR
jgi:internalin A